MIKQHYFSLVFADDAGRTRSITMKTSAKAVTAPLIRDAIQALDMSENVALISACWLGRMTERQYTHGITPVTGWGLGWRIAAPLALIALCVGLYLYFR